MGVFRTRNASESWEKVTEGMVAFDAKMASMAMGVNRIVIDGTNPDLIFAGTTQGLFKSTNQGDRWQKIGNALGDVFISGIQLDPINPQTIYIATSDGVQKSIDGGETWELKKTGLDATSIRSIQMSPIDTKTLYAGTNGGGLYRTINGGDTWTRISLTMTATQ